MDSPRRAPRVFTIPASAPFLQTLVPALLDARVVPGFGAGDDPLALAGATLFLPTRRACRQARELFLAARGEAAILPRIVPIGDIDEDELAFADSAFGDATDETGTAGFGPPPLDLPEAMGLTERRLLLARLILHWAPRLRSAAATPLVASTPATALMLADDLARLMDDMTTRQTPWDRLDGLTPDALDPYWQYTLDFLRIARETWPAILSERGLIEPAARRDLLIAAEARRLERAGGPVVAAGSTASMPATAQLLATIAGLPQGAVVLPGLDTDLDDASWDAIDTQTGPQTADTADADAAGDPAIGHPQFALHAFLDRLGLARADVQPLAAPLPHGRERLVAEALRPAATTDLWQARQSAPDWPQARDRALADVTVIAAATPEEEALAIAIALRETAQTPERTAALVTPDRALARRVLAQLDRWALVVDDSGGDALPDTAAGRFARLAADAACAGLAPVPLLALLKHPLLRLGRAEGGWLDAVHALELALLRGPRPRAGAAGLAHALETFRAELALARTGRSGTLHRSDPRLALTDSALDATAALVAALAAALAPLETLPGGETLALADLAARHAAAVSALSADEAGVPIALAGTDGHALAQALAEIAAHGDGDFVMTPADYGEALPILLADRVVRRPERSDARIRIFGPLEARLQAIDRVVLGGMVEGVWPPEARSDPWLSRPMRQALGLDLPERRISLSAHDFAQTFGAPEVLLTYPAKQAGAPTVSSRFLQRLQAVSGPAFDAALARGHRYLAFARRLDVPATAPQPTAPPEPRPPLAARPRQLSVTAIENLLRDPYTIYAQRILRLAPLDAVDTPPGAADRGTVVHGAIEDFVRRHSDRLPDDAAAELLALGRARFRALDDYPEARAFWWPRFVRIAHWFAAWEAERRPQLAALTVEADGRIVIPLPDGDFTLTARADRIEHHADGGYAIVDYKTGAIPSNSQVQSGLAPQMTLEAAILRRGGFPGIPAGGTVAALTYIGLKGGEPPGLERKVALKDGTPDTEAERALAELTQVLRRYADPAQPYRSLALSMWSTRYGDYDHLARVKEWAGAAGEDEA